MKDNYIERVAAWCFLHLANIGVNWEEMVAQWIASVLISGDLSGKDQREAVGRIADRIVDLKDHPEEVWDGLLPGGASQVTVDDFTLMTDAEFANFDEAKRRYDAVREAFGKNYNHELFHDYEARLVAIGKALKGEDPNAPDEFEYTISIIIHPEVRHDEASDLIKDAETYHDTSPLYFWSIVYREIDMLDKMGRWPAEELAGWITHLKSGQSYLMTWDQAVTLKALHDAEEVIECVGAGPLDFDEHYQGISDQMTFAGDEYHNRRTSV